MKITFEIVACKTYRKLMDFDENRPPKRPKNDTKAKPFGLGGGCSKTWSHQNGKIEFNFVLNDTLRGPTFHK